MADKWSVYKTGHVFWYVTKQLESYLSPEQIKDVDNLCATLRTVYLNHFKFEANDNSQAHIVKALSRLLIKNICPSPDLSILNETKVNSDHALFYDLSNPKFKDKLDLLLSQLQKSLRSRKKVTKTSYELSVYDLGLITWENARLLKSPLNATQLKTIDNLAALLAKTDSKTFKFDRGNRTQHEIISAISSVFLELITPSPNVSILNNTKTNSNNELFYDLSNLKVRDKIFLLFSQLHASSNLISTVCPSVCDLVFSDKRSHLRAVPSAGKTLCTSTPPCLRGRSSAWEMPFSPTDSAFGIDFIPREGYEAFFSTKSGLAFWDDLCAYIRGFPETLEAEIYLGPTIVDTLRAYTEVALLDLLNPTSTNGMGAIVYVSCDKRNHICLADITHYYFIEIFTSNNNRKILKYKDDSNAILYPL